MKRARFLNAFLFFISLIFFSYLFYIQCLRHNYYETKAKKQHQKKMIVLGARGNIYDRNGLPLATSERCYSIFCTPRYSPDKTRLINELTRLTYKGKREIRKLVKQNKFFWVARKVSNKKKEEFMEIEDPSIGFTNDLNRRYNMPEIFSNLIGRCGLDNRGIEGLELQLNEVLNGQSGFTIYQKCPTGELIPYANYPEKEPKPGRDVYLTIDLQLQATLYQHLKQCLLKEEARYAAGLIINPRTGEILALVNVGAENDKRNHVICDEFEPGSTFKVITLAYALLHGFKETNIINTEGGKVTVRGHTIHDFRNYGIITLKQAIAHSSNVAMVKISQKFDREGFYLLMRDFGLGELTGIEFPGEVTGRIPDWRKLNDVEFATLSFGQGVAVNLLQLAFVYQAIANNGVLNKPLLISSIKDHQRTVYRGRPLRIRRVIPQEYARRITEILCDVVEEGSGTAAAVEGVRVAGKTGTAQKVVNGRYSRNAIITTFIGYFPAESPEYLIAIMFDEPKKGYWASTIAAPVFKDVAQSIYQIGGLHYAIKNTD